MRMIGVMGNTSHSTIPFNKEVSDMVKRNNLSDVRSAVICVIIILNVIMNSLVIAVISRYPQLREDRPTIFMFSLSVSDLAAGCTFMPTSAAPCSGKMQRICDDVAFLQKVHAFAMCLFGYKHIHGMC